MAERASGGRKIGKGDGHGRWDEGASDPLEEQRSGKLGRRREDGGSSRNLQSCDDGGAGADRERGNADGQFHDGHKRHKQFERSSSSDSATISANDFLTLLVTEMQNQDPTADTDPNEYINQLVQVNSLEQLIDINQTLSDGPGRHVCEHGQRHNRGRLTEAPPGAPVQARAATGGDTQSQRSCRSAFTDRSGSHAGGDGSADMRRPRALPAISACRMRIPRHSEWRMRWMGECARAARSSATVAFCDSANLSTSPALSRPQTHSELEEEIDHGKFLNSADRA